MGRTFDEIRVYGGVAERTGVQFERNSVRRSSGYCGTLAALIRKARMSGDGTFYLPVELWPENTTSVDLHKPWVAMSSLAE